ncbi:ABC transporter substrate-binding protein [Alicyclobacillus shizuokensis]|uniref:ABC transporter substrate-binding protein n=1 Tax=Alicyclobacillus shizuokensis TaxID=392014 RepID=UPI00082BDFB6|nr:ABC transporter substrate-binding protein [Alicyclobacillus shizuokensis]
MKVAGKTKVLVAGVLIAGTLATACSPSQTQSAVHQSGTTTIVFWDLFGGADGTTMNQIVKKFNQTHPSIHVQEETQDWGQYYTKLITAVLGGKAPDLAISHVDHIGILRTQGVIEPLDKEAASAGIKWSQFFEPPMKDAVINGKHYAIPLDIHTYLLFYNKKVLQSAGISPSQLNIASYNDFVSICNQVKEHGYVPLSFGESGWGPLAIWETFYYQMGGTSLLNKAGTKETFTDATNDAVAIKAMQKLYDLYNTSHIIPSNISNPDELFKSGKAAFCIEGTWSVDDFHKALGDQLGVAQMPVFFQQPAAWADSHTFVLPVNPNRTPEQTKDAMIFVKWIENHAWMWAKAGHIPANKIIQNTPQFKALPYRSNYGSQASFVKYFPMTDTVWMMSDNEILNKLQGILLKQTPVARGVQEMGQILDRQLEE